ncbi:hypothetical protein PILCRDRAFT_198197 [Piloderma croceum F 1598]|uniref:Uncharacterized protein n=1 Tax=Piloderma croceum (strain F 1598) TaxID=765440 RepID=A0A0C3G0S6_PILCF|nr:hypothetical protein PILCRDRAFT_198197 [Piloderma croceum F 1598]
MGACAPNLAGVKEKVSSGGEADPSVFNVACRRNFRCLSKVYGQSANMISFHQPIPAIKDIECNDIMSLARLTFCPTTEVNDKTLINDE